MPLQTARWGASRTADTMGLIVASPDAPDASDKEPSPPARRGPGRPRGSGVAKKHASAAGDCKPRRGPGRPRGSGAASSNLRRVSMPEMRKAGSSRPEAKGKGRADDHHSKGVFSYFVLGCRNSVGILTLWYASWGIHRRTSSCSTKGHRTRAGRSARGFVWISSRRSCLCWLDR